MNKAELVSQVAGAIDAARKPLKAEDVINAPLNKKSVALRRLRAQEKRDTALVSAEKAINAIFESIRESLQKGDNVQLIGFGSFAIKQRPATTARNPRTGENIQIAAKRVVRFSPGKALKEAVAVGAKETIELEAIGDKPLPKRVVKAKKPGNS